MRKAFTFVACIGILAGALMAAGCKPRNLRQLIMPYVPSSAAALECVLNGSYTFDGDDLEFQVNGSTLSGVYSDCGESGNQRVYEIRVTDGGGWLEIDAYEFDDNVHMSWRNSCDPTEDDEVTCEDDSWCEEYCESDLEVYVENGTYYLVVYTDGDDSGWVEIEWD